MAFKYVEVCECATCVNAGNPRAQQFTTGLAAIILDLMKGDKIWNAPQIARYGWGIKFCSDDQQEWFTLRPKLTKTLWRLWKSGVIEKTSRGHYRKR